MPEAPTAAPSMAEQSAEAKQLMTSMKASLSLAQSIHKELSDSRHHSGTARLKFHQSGADAIAAFYRDARKVHQLHGRLSEPGVADKSLMPNERKELMVQAEAEAYQIRLMTAKIEAYEQLFMSRSNAAKSAAQARRPLTSMPKPKADNIEPQRMLAAAERHAKIQLARESPREASKPARLMPGLPEKGRPRSYDDRAYVPTGPEAALLHPNPYEEDGYSVPAPTAAHAFMQPNASLPTHSGVPKPTRHNPATLPSTELAGGSAYKEMLQEVTMLMRGVVSAVRNEPAHQPPVEAVRAALAQQTTAASSSSSSQPPAPPPAVAPPPQPTPIPAYAQELIKQGRDILPGEIHKPATVPADDIMPTPEMGGSGQALGVDPVVVPMGAADTAVTDILPSAGATPFIVSPDEGSGSTPPMQQATILPGQQQHASIVPSGSSDVEARRYEAMLKAKEAEMAATLRAREAEMEAAVERQRELERQIASAREETLRQQQARAAAEAEAAKDARKVAEAEAAAAAAQAAQQHAMRSAAEGGMGWASGAQSDRPSLIPVPSSRAGPSYSKGPTSSVFQSVLSAQQAQEERLREEWAALEAKRAAESEKECQALLELQQRSMEKQQELQQELNSARQQAERLRLDLLKEQQQRQLATRRRTIEAETEKVKQQLEQVAKQRAASTIQKSARTRSAAHEKEKRIEEEAAAAKLANARAEAAAVRMEEQRIRTATDQALAGSLPAAALIGIPTQPPPLSAQPAAGGGGGGGGGADSESALMELIMKLMIDDMASAQPAPPIPQPEVLPPPPTELPPLPPSAMPDPVAGAAAPMAACAAAQDKAASASAAAAALTKSCEAALEATVAAQTSAATSKIASEVDRMIERLDAAKERQNLEVGLESAKAVATEMASVLADKLAAALPSAATIASLREEATRSRTPPPPQYVFMGPPQMPMMMGPGGGETSGSYGGGSSTRKSSKRKEKGKKGKEEEATKVVDAEDEAEVAVEQQPTNVAACAAAAMPAMTSAAHIHDSYGYASEGLASEGEVRRMDSSFSEGELGFNYGATFGPMGAAPVDYSEGEVDV